MLANTLSRGVIDISKVSVTDCIRKEDVSNEKKMEIMTHAHNMTGHAGRDVMIEYIQNYIKWNNMKGDIRDFIKNCEPVENTELIKATFRNSEQI